ncbi:MAG: hypothetical protein L6R40_004982 [Gallowayella cf. fulva]|nr:MAG: hypothetical protein L6R40_004982 [Xanthomendoza cf. fulva]
MRTSWTNDSVTIISIPKNRAPNFNGPILWPSTDNQTFFAFGGELSNWAGLTGPDVSCWQFTIDGNGGGSWPIFQPGVQSTFRDLTRPAVATGTTLDNTGFIFRGSASIRSAPQNRQIQDGVYTPIPGIVSFNNTSTLWQNDTVPQYIEDLNAPQGMLATADTFGTRVARAIVGLMQYLRCNDVYAYRKIRGLASDVYNPPPFNNVTIYDPSDKTWHAQTATVQIPAARSKPCTVGVPGDNGTYEIFMYGSGNIDGLDGNITLTQYQEFLALDEVYVLSLPAFRWFKADYPAQHPRFRHSCNVVGNRQMLSIGGQDPTNQYNNTFTADPFLQGLGIFDLTAMRWSDRYNADAEPYESPAVVKACTEHADKSASQKSGSNHTGAIAGGVAGGIAALFLLAGLSIWWLRRRKSKATDNALENPTLAQYSHEHHDQSARLEKYPIEMHEDNRPWEMDGTDAPAELGGTHRAELRAEIGGPPARAKMDGQQEAPRRTDVTRSDR